jgi:hypothetical protein
MFLKLNAVDVWFPRQLEKNCSRQSYVAFKKKNHLYLAWEVVLYLTLNVKDPWLS